jgi:hypothetical protein
VQSAREGVRVVVLDLQPGIWEIDGTATATVEACGMGPRHFVSRATGHPLADGFQPEDFQFWYDDEEGRISPILNNLILGEGGLPVLSSGQLGWGLPLAVADAVREYPIGEGSIIFCCLELKGHLSNPVACEFLERLLRPCPEETSAGERGGSEPAAGHRVPSMRSKLSISGRHG